MKLKTHPENPVIPRLHYKVIAISAVQDDESQFSQIAFQGRGEARSDLVCLTLKPFRAEHFGDSRDRAVEQSIAMGQHSYVYCTEKEAKKITLGHIIASEFFVVELDV